MTLSDTPARETSLEAGGSAKGVAVAVVRENKDDSGMARVKVSYPWHSKPQQSYWARVVAPMAGGTRGAYFVPEVGDEVLVAFDRGDLRFPYVMGGLWNGVDSSPVNNGNGKNDLRLVRSRSGHQLTFDDGSKGRVQLELKDGKTLRIDDDGILLDDGKGNSLEIKTTDGSMTIKAAQQLSIQAPQISIEATGTLDAKANATVTIQGAIVQIN